MIFGVGLAQPLVTVFQQRGEFRLSLDANAFMNMLPPKRVQVHCYLSKCFDAMQSKKENKKIDTWCFLKLLKCNSLNYVPIYEELIVNKNQSEPLGHHYTRRRNTCFERKDKLRIWVFHSNKKHEYTKRIISTWYAKGFSFTPFCLIIFRNDVCLINLRNETVLLGKTANAP
jgi:hypothetical protein